MVQKKNSIYLYIVSVGQVAQAAKRLDTGWTIQVQSQMSEGWRFFFTPPCPDLSWDPLSLLQNEYQGLSPGIKEAELKMHSLFKFNHLKWEHVV